MKKIHVGAVFCVLMLFFIVPLYGEDDNCTEAGCSPAVSDQIEPNIEPIEVLTYEEFSALRSSPKNIILVDVRSQESFLEGHIAGAISIPLQEIVDGITESRLSKDEKIVVYCGSASCGASTVAAAKLKDMGYTVMHYKGGVGEWMEKGNLLVKD